MENKVQIFESFTPAQRKEFDDDIKQMTLKVGAEYNFGSTKVAKINTNMRLQNEVFLNVTLLVHFDEHGEAKGTIEKLVKFNTIDEYLDSINEANSPDAKGKRLK